VEIASRLGISHRTVETHKARALRKMGARSVVSLINGGLEDGVSVPTEAAPAFEDMPCGYHSLARDASIIAMNNTELEWLGYERAEVIGHLKYSDLLTPDSLELFKRHFLLFTKTGKLTDLVLEVVAKDGSVLNFLVNATLRRDADGEYLYSRFFVVNLADRRQIQARQAEMTHLREIRSTVLEDQTDLISRFHTDGTMIYANEVYARFFGMKLSELVGKSWQPTAHPEDVPFIEEMLKGLTPGNSVVMVENRVIDGSGAIRWMQFVNRGFFDANGQLREIQSVGRDISDHKHAEAEVQHQAHYDSLTNLPNRRLFKKHLPAALSRAEHSGGEVAVCYLDLDRFKAINDRYGHQAGDEVLQEVGIRLGNVLRTQDFVARIGGDEFVLILDGIDSRGECDVILRRVAVAIAEPITLQSGQTITISPSIGVAVFPCDAREAEKLLRYSDAAMFEAKRSGGNSVLFFRRN